MRYTEEISIHAPLAGCDCPSQRYGSRTCRFQSTHPLRGATELTAPLGHDLIISIHAPLAGCDGAYPGRGSDLHHFNPRTPCGVRPECSRCGDVVTRISIHAPLAGCDLFVLGDEPVLHISIHAPLAGCDGEKVVIFSGGGKFQSTHPLRGATVSHAVSTTFTPFQSTHPLRGATKRAFPRAQAERDFNPRTPCGVRQRRIPLLLGRM